MMPPTCPLLYTLAMQPPNLRNNIQTTVRVVFAMSQVVSGPPDVAERVNGLVDLVCSTLLVEYTYDFGGILYPFEWFIIRQLEYK